MSRRRLGSERIVDTIEEEWAKTRPAGGGVGSTEGKIVCDRLVAEGVDVPGKAVSCVLENLWYEGFIEGIPYRDRSGVPAREDGPIIGPK
jgi:hypothetical protein